MKRRKASVADLRNNFAQVSPWVSEGEAVTITKRGKDFAVLQPIGGAGKAPPKIDRLARLKKMFPRGPVRGDVLDYDRGD